ncbi:hypothetical protein Syun_014192 [Stephania yunnanensis]|uniref:Uncharacterized protein n=1 Tax=Stephania yunnanensis TaxID=152371 RepID=A0AAP0JJ18_9MAGN
MTTGKRGRWKEARERGGGESLVERCSRERERGKKLDFSTHRLSSRSSSVFVKTQSTRRFLVISNNRMPRQREALMAKMKFGKAFTEYLHGDNKKFQGKLSHVEYKKMKRVLKRCRTVNRGSCRLGSQEETLESGESPPSLPHCWPNMRRC